MHLILNITAYFTHAQNMSIGLKVQVLVAQSCLTPCYPMDCSPPGSSVHEILQARVLEWAAQKEQFISVLYLLK